MPTTTGNKWTSTARAIRALTEHTKYVENHITLLSAASTQGISALSLSLPLIQSTITSAIPYLAIIDGSCRLTLGLTQIVLSLTQDHDRDSQEYGDAYNGQIPNRGTLTQLGIEDIVGSIPLLACTLLNSAPLGFAITNTLECFRLLIAFLCIQHGAQKVVKLNKGRISIEYKNIPFNYLPWMAKCFETAGWWMFMLSATSPPLAPFACLAFLVSAAIKTWNGNLCTTVQEDWKYTKEVLTRKKPEPAKNYSSKYPSLQFLPFPSPIYPHPALTFRESNKDKRILPRPRFANAREDYSQYSRARF